jgi:hypothetical protein
VEGAGLEVGPEVRDEVGRAASHQDDHVPEGEGSACRGCPEEPAVSDPFGKLRELAAKREQADWDWRFEVLNLKAAGYSLRAIADAAGVSHDTIWRLR